jgi:hypothetical protein
LQKSALVRLTDEGGDLTVFDRQNPQKIARYFENFLDALRLHEDDALTETLVRVTREVIRANRDLVPPDVYREMTKRTYDAASAGGNIEVDNQKAFLEAVLGRNLPDDNPLVGKFKSALKRARIDGTPVALNAAKVLPPRTRRLVTLNNIQIRVPIDMEQHIDVQDQRIIINDPLANQYDDAEVVS